MYYELNHQTIDPVQITAPGMPRCRTTRCRRCERWVELELGENHCDSCKVYLLTAGEVDPIGKSADWLRGFIGAMRQRPRVVFHPLPDALDGFDAAHRWYTQSN